MFVSSCFHAYFICFQFLLSPRRRGVWFLQCAMVTACIRLVHLFWGLDVCPKTVGWTVSWCQFRRYLQCFIILMLCEIIRNVITGSPDLLQSGKVTYMPSCANRAGSRKVPWLEKTASCLFVFSPSRFPPNPPTFLPKQRAETATPTRQKRPHTAAKQTVYPSFII